MEEIISQLTSSFDMKLMLSITLLSYILIKGLEKLKYKTSRLFKRIITAIVAIVLCYIYYKYINITLEQIVPTYLISIVFYDYIIKGITNKLKINYRQ